MIYVQSNMLRVRYKKPCVDMELLTCKSVNLGVFSVSTLSQLVSPQVVKTITPGAITDNKFGIMSNSGFQCPFQDIYTVPTFGTLYRVCSQSIYAYSSVSLQCNLVSPDRLDYSYYSPQTVVRYCRETNRQSWLLVDLQHRRQISWSHVTKS